MKNLNNKIIFLEISGVFSTLIFMLLLRLCYFTSIKNALTIMFGYTNMSIWEHNKVLVLSYFLWSFFEFCFIRANVRKYFFSKIIAAYFLLFSSIPLFYTCIPIYNHFDFLAFLCICFLLITASNLLFVKLIFLNLYLFNFKSIFIFLTIILFSSLLLLSVFPPKNFLFFDLMYGIYGVI